MTSSDIEQIRTQLSDTERANTQMLSELKRLGKVADALTALDQFVTSSSAAGIYVNSRLQRTVEEALRQSAETA